jgi:hypothetical protein
MHHIYLDNLMHHLDLVGVPRQQISMILREPEWFDDRAENKSLCDLIFCLRDNTAVGLELKGSDHKRSKAIEQLDMGARFTNMYLKHKYVAGIFAVYLEPKRYYYERIPYDRQKAT